MSFTFELIIGLMHSTPLRLIICTTDNEDIEDKDDDDSSKTCKPSMQVSENCGNQSFISSYEVYPANRVFLCGHAKLAKVDTCLRLFIILQ